jgi:hypothetical protein
MGRNGVADTTSYLNIDEEHHTSERMVHVMFVYVLNCHGHPLMPCQPRKARLLLKAGKAKVVRMVPFTLQLLYGSSGYDDTWHVMKFVRRNNRQLHKATIRKGGKRQRNTAPRSVHGFRLFDCVSYQGQTCFVFGRRRSGYFDLRTLDGAKIHASASFRKLKGVQRASTCLVERRSGIPPTPEGAGILPPAS